MGFFKRRNKAKKSKQSKTKNDQNSITTNDLTNETTSNGEKNDESTISSKEREESSLESQREGESQTEKLDKEEEECYTIPVDETNNEIQSIIHDHTDCFSNSAGSTSFQECIELVANDISRKRFLENENEKAMRKNSNTKEKGASVSSDEDEIVSNTSYSIEHLKTFDSGFTRVTVLEDDKYLYENEGLRIDETKTFSNEDLKTTTSKSTFVPIPEADDRYLLEHKESLLHGPPSPIMRRYIKAKVNHSNAFESFVSTDECDDDAVIIKNATFGTVSFITPSFSTINESFSMVSEAKTEDKNALFRARDKVITNNLPEIRREDEEFGSIKSSCASSKNIGTNYISVQTTEAKSTPEDQRNPLDLSSDKGYEEARTPLSPNSILKDLHRMARNVTEEEPDTDVLRNQSFNSRVASQDQPQSRTNASSCVNKETKANSPIENKPFDGKSNIGKTISHTKSSNHEFHDQDLTATRALFPKQDTSIESHKLEDARKKNVLRITIQCDESYGLGPQSPFMQSIEMRVAEHQLASKDDRRKRHDTNNSKRNFIHPVEREKCTSTYSIQMLTKPKCSNADAEKAARQEVFKIVKRKIDFAQRQKSTNMMSKATRKKSKKRSFFFFWRKKKKSKASTASSFSKKKSEKGDIKHIVYASPRNEQEKEIFILKDFL